MGEAEEVDEAADASLEEKVALTAGPVVLDESGPYQTCTPTTIQVLVDRTWARRRGALTAKLRKYASPPVLSHDLSLPPKKVLKRTLVKVTSFEVRYTIPVWARASVSFA